jgi:hypothetical protein
MWYPVISVALPNEMISSYHFISFIPNEMMGAKRALKELFGILHLSQKNG